MSTCLQYKYKCILPTGYKWYGLDMLHILHTIVRTTMYVLRNKPIEIKSWPPSFVAADRGSATEDGGFFDGDRFGGYLAGFLILAHLIRS
jgi:hypothetical protein